MTDDARELLAAFVRAHDNCTAVYPDVLATARATLADPAPVPLELVACLRALVRGWDTDDDDGATFFAALHAARRALAVLDATKERPTP